jgi:hypothetical protein
MDTASLAPRTTAATSAFPSTAPDRRVCGPRSPRLRNSRGCASHDAPLEGTSRPAAAFDRHLLISASFGAFGYRRRCRLESKSPRRRRRACPIGCWSKPRSHGSRHSGRRRMGRRRNRSCALGSMADTSSRRPSRSRSCRPIPGGVLHGTAGTVRNPAAGDARSVARCAGRRRRAGRRPRAAPPDLRMDRCRYRRATPHSA